MDQPQFATVTFVSEHDASLSSTFRVPIGRETSVRHLAKDAMQRLVMSRFANVSGGPKNFPAISVSEVRVGGLAPQNAEIFARDLVTQVVLVKEEVIYMKLQVAARTAPQDGSNGAATTTQGVPADAKGVEETTTTVQAPLQGMGASEATTRASSPAPAPAAPSCSAPAPAPAPVPAPMLSERPVNIPAPTTAAAAAAAAAKTKKETVSASVPAKKAAAAAAPPATRAAPKRPRDEPTAPAPDHKAKVANTVMEDKPHRAGWGPEATLFFPDNYCSSPDKLMRRKRAAAAAAAAASKQEVPPKDGQTEKATRTTRVEKKKEEESRPPGWGPEAYKSFPTNYVSSPDRLAREIRKQQREQEKLRKANGTAASASDVAVAAPPIAIRPKKIARQLDYEEEGRRSTVGHHVDSALVVEDEEEEQTETTSAAPLPKGWGSQAAKYFDPETYCDDPRKAKVNIADRPRSVRPHRTPPAALFK